MNGGAGPGAHWERLTPLSLALAPLGWLVCALAWLRRLAYRRGWRRTGRLAVPVVVVGNLTVGGTGKTPLVIWLAGVLRAQGYRPGIIARGYRGRARTWPQPVTAQSDPDEVGDEAVLLAASSGCPVAVGPDRVAAGRRLLQDSDCDVVLSDDGLQHYRLHRDFEIAVVDGVRRFGNGLCLPAGPLREPVSRLASVDLVVTNGPARAGELAMGQQLTAIRSLADRQQLAEVRTFTGGPIHAVAGIGNPERFFDQLRALGMKVMPHPFPDHHRFRADDLAFADAAPILLTAKDAVKCRTFARPGMWVVEVEARPDPRVAEAVMQRLKEVSRG